jgi:hypothetical protein
MTGPYAGAYRPRWADRGYYPALARFLPLVAECDAKCVPNFLAHHIGVWHTDLRRSRNFVGFKGSRQCAFSIEIKIDPDERESTELRSRGWHVEPWSNVSGYRVHLPNDLSSEDITYLQDLIRRAYQEWPRRNPIR